MENRLSQDLKEKLNQQVRERVHQHLIKKLKQSQKERERIQNQRQQIRKNKPEDHKNLKEKQAVYHALKEKEHNALKEKEHNALKEKEHNALKEKPHELHEKEHHVVFKKPENSFNLKFKQNLNQHHNLVKPLLSLEKQHIEKQNLEKHQIVAKKIDMIDIKEEKKEKEAEIIKKEVIESYKLKLDKAEVEIRIEKEERGIFYNLYMPQIEIGTQALLDDVRKDLIAVTSMGEIVDQKSVTAIKNRFMEDAGRLLVEKVPGMNKNTEEFLVGMLMQEMLGLGKIEFLISDAGLEEIVIVSSREPVRAFHKKYGWLLTNIIPQSEEEINNYSNIIARRVGRQISVLTPLLDAHVVTGDRANAVLYPIATKGNTITIRKFARDPWTIIDLINNRTASLDVAVILWLAIEYEMNILISGGTASGKTVFLNACMPFIPPNHRIISMEDTRELMLPDFLYWCPLVTRSPNAEGKGEVSMLDLLVNSLRMRPDRIVLGEIRRQREAEVLFEAMHTGHSVYATVHADTANETIRRLINPPVNIAPSMLRAVNLNVVMFRDRRKGIRRVSQLAEFVPGKDSVVANILYRWVPDKDEITAHNNSMNFFDELSRHTGMSQTDINKDLDEKKEILKWMIKNKIRDLNSLGKVMNMYYTNLNSLQEAIKKNDIKKFSD